MNTKMTKKDVAASAADANEEQQKKIWQLNKKKKTYYELRPTLPITHESEIVITI